MYTPSDDEVRFIAAYMNEAHPEVVREIADAHGIEAGAIEVCGMTDTELLLQVQTEDGSALRPVPWPAPLRRREDIRLFLEEMQEDARFKSP